ncbi:MAG: transporter substrate-binding domain-containing protein [Pseudomonadota bacterium]
MKNLLCLAALLLPQLAGGTTPHLRVCSLTLAPQTMKGEDGLPTGYAVEILQHVAVNLGWQIQIDYMPWARVTSEMQLGRCDMAMTVLYFKDYAEYMRFPNEAILDQKNVLLVRRESKIRFDGDLETFMRSHSIGVYADKRVNEKFERLRAAPWAKVDTVSSSDLNLKKLLAKRFDAVIENDLSSIYELRKQGRLDEVDILHPPLSVTPAYIVFSRAPESENHMKQYDVELARFKKTPKFRALTNKYLPESAGAQ